MNLIERLERARDHAGPNGQLFQEAIDQINVAYLEGYRTAAEDARSVTLKVSADLDPAIQLGIDATSTILQRNLRLLNIDVIHSA